MESLRTEDSVICSFFIPKFSIPKALLQTKNGIKNASPYQTLLKDSIMVTKKKKKKNLDISYLISNEPVSIVDRNCANTITLKR